jgi:hypothetical protein
MAQIPALEQAQKSDQILVRSEHTQYTSQENNPQQDLKKKPTRPTQISQQPLLWHSPENPKSSSDTLLRHPGIHSIAGKAVQITGASEAPQHVEMELRDPKFSTNPVFDRISFSTRGESTEESSGQAGRPAGLCSTLVDLTPVNIVTGRVWLCESRLNWPPWLAVHVKMLLFEAHF